MNLLNQTNTPLPVFSEIKPENIETDINKLISDATYTIEKQLTSTTNYNWKNLVEPIENAEDLLDQAWSPVSHMNSVVNNDELRNAYNACLPKLSEYSTSVGQNLDLFKAYEYIKNSGQFKELDAAQQKIINNNLRDFHLSGIDLSDADKNRYKEISQQLSQLSSKFEENVLDATNDWCKAIDDSSILQGLPASALQQARQSAEQRQLSGWAVTLQFPSYIAVMTYADNRELRQEVYSAFCTRASEQNSEHPEWDNSEVMEQLLALRHEKARLLGFDSYAHYSLATKMAESPEQVTAFLYDLAKKSKKQAQQDYRQLQEFAAEQYGQDDLKAWDIGYYSEKMRQFQYQLSQEQVKKYFPISKVLPGLFNIVEKLFGLEIQEILEFDRWHEDVRFFEIHDDQGELRGQFYIDLYARAKKRGGAWMDVCTTRKKYRDQVQTPVAYLTCNFTPPTADTPALLTHDEVTTLFHEFGHGLHHMLTKVDHLAVSGINGVEWDAVELPSQFLENWCWDKQALQLISGHYESGEVLPDALFDKMLAAKNFQSGMMMVRQLEFSLFDFLIHLNYDPNKGGHIYQTLDQVRSEVSVVIPPAFNRFAHGFSHIFAGGYAAGYYSYKWAEVLSSDAFSLFEENGIFDRQTGRAFCECILEKGGSDSAMQLFKQFRGREPQGDALLRHNGITG